jgi:hypothetical protein
MSMTMMSCIDMMDIHPNTSIAMRYAYGCT